MAIGATTLALTNGPIRRGEKWARFTVVILVGGSEGNNAYRMFPFDSPWYDPLSFAVLAVAGATLVGDGASATECGKIAQHQALTARRSERVLGLASWVEAEGLLAERARGAEAFRKPSVREAWLVQGGWLHPWERLFATGGRFEFFGVRRIAGQPPSWACSAFTAVVVIHREAVQDGSRWSAKRHHRSMSENAIAP